MAGLWPWPVSHRLVLIVIFFFAVTDCLLSKRQRIVHVSVFGNDADDCGAIGKPCRTIAVAASRVASGGIIMLNGTGAEQRPFDCKKPITWGQRGIWIRRNVTITSLDLTRACIRCLTGFHFYRSNRDLRVSLAGITFLETPLRFKDCFEITLINCTHQNAKEAVTVRSTNTSTANLTIRGSLFQNNSLCVKIQFFEGSGTDLKFSLDIKDTKFLKNGFLDHFKTLFRGAVEFSNEGNLFRKIYPSIAVEKVRSADSGGHFLKIDLPTAITSEKYDDVVLERNNFDFSQRKSRSLYFSRVLRARVTFDRLQCKDNYQVMCVKIDGRTNATVFVRVHDSCFHNNSAYQADKLWSAIFRVVGSEGHSGNVTISNTLFVKNNLTAIGITPNFYFTLVNVTVSSSLNGLRIISWDRRNENNFNLSVTIEGCKFQKNIHDIYGLLNNTINIFFRMTNTLFDGKEIKRHENSTFGIRLITPHLERKNFSETAIELEDVTFKGKPSNSFTFTSEGKKTIVVRRCLFRDGFGLEIDQWKRVHHKHIPTYTTSQGALLLLFNTDALENRGCVDNGVTNNTHRTWKYSSHVLFEDTLFQNNLGHIAGAVQIINGYVKFQRCKFINNFSERNTGQIYVGYGSAKVEFNSCVFKRTKLSKKFRGIAFTFSRFFYSESGGPIKVLNTSFYSGMGNRLTPGSVLQITSGGYFEMDSSSTIQCAVGSELQFSNFSHFIYDGGEDSHFCRINLTTEIFSCKMCPPKMYSLQSGFSRGLKVSKGFRCQECPFGAHCNGPNNILAKLNFWGYKIPNASNFSSLKFVPCPWEYCLPQSIYKYHGNDYNKCRGFRSGIMCGRCATGYSETLFSSECRQSHKCKWNYLWVLMGLYTVLLTIYLLKKPPLVLYLKRQILWFKTEGQAPLEIEERLSLHRAEDPEYGYLRIVFYFYQVAQLLLTDSLEDILAKVPYISTLVAAFNFKVRVLDENIGCPFAGLTAVTKELFLSALVFAAIAHVFIVYCLHRSLNLVIDKGRPSFTHYVAVAVEILLLGYERLAETSLKLLQCVPIGSKWRLTIDGNTVCWQWWQHGLLAYIIIFVVPFVGVLYWGSGKLYAKAITWKEFVGACIVPLPFLVRWFLQSACNRQPGSQTQLRHECTDEISKILHGPFRPPSKNDRGVLYWESVLIGSRLVLLTFRAFILNSMICFLCLSVACILMLVHHLVKKPFRHPSAEKLGTLSLITLACIAVMNLTTATLSSSATKPEGPNKHIMVVFRWIVVILLCLFPALVVLLALFALVSQLARLALFLKRKTCAFFCAIKFHYEFLDESTALLTD
ncbi:uncharacterized protein LOC111323167 [Stylophora pistillata]|uniref:uncharacterized protein LOC111323167 n=1 Tax=Stylophora pistillata TaxID=50429 RepID=UPI000C04E38C|nr:uncharacterized protein LOC111323167 [Stylophora pistillata]